MLKNYPIKALCEIPKVLKEIALPPKKLFIRGELPDPSFIRLAVVGSRKYTPYGKEACKRLITGLKNYPVCIVSGLALGIDSIAHEAALENGLPTMAVPGSGLDEDIIYPYSHVGLVKRILDKGGCMLSEYKGNERSAPWMFPQRNRIMAGLSKAILVIEAQQKSGTMITARLATEYNRDVLTVPGSIFSKMSEGTNFLLRMGATPIRDSKDILEALGIACEEKKENNFDDCSEEEIAVIKLLDIPKTREEICEELDISAKDLASILTILELKDVIKESAGKIYLA